MSCVRFGREITSLHLEITGRCNLGCAGCIRTSNPQGRKDALSKDLTLDQLLELIDPYDITHLEHIYACGNIGDPIASKYVVEIFQGLKEINPEAYHSIHTNGSLRSVQWWRDLVPALARRHRVVFAIDGLEDTNHLYRKGALWSKVMENAKAFIEAGGTAEWHFIIFEHNEHQVEEARELATALGFDKFSTLNSTRPKQEGLEYKRSETYVAPKSEVVCTALEKKELFISAHGQIYPCCYLATAGFGRPRQMWEVDYDNEAACNRVPESPTLSVCNKNCSRVNGKDIWAQQFE